MTFASQEGIVKVPAIDVVSFSFDKQKQFEDDIPILVDAEDPSRFLTYTTCKALVRKLVAGLRHYGLHTGQSVMCHMANSVSMFLV